MVAIENAFLRGPTDVGAPYNIVLYYYAPAHTANIRESIPPRVKKSAFNEGLD